MKQGGKRWLLRLIGLPVLGILILVWMAARQSQNSLTIENRSGKTIALLTVAAGDRSHTFDNVPAGKTLTMPFALSSTQRLTVDGQFAGGAILRGRFASLADLASSGPPRLVIQPWGSITLELAGQR